jgi:hypothetical protein
LLSRSIVQLPLSNFPLAIYRPADASARYSIEGQVTALYGDLRNKAETEAVFSIQIFVTETVNPDRRIVLQRNYSQKVRVPDRSAEAITKGLSAGLQQSFSALETDLRALKVKP